jgi:hypothetical protein
MYLEQELVEVHCSSYWLLSIAIAYSPFAVQSMLGFPFAPSA